jgi:hypothetical protein
MLKGYQNIFSLFLIVSGLININPAIAQSSDETIDLKQIKQKEVRNLVRREKVKRASDYQQIKTACYLVADSSGYQTSLKTYIVKARIGTVWEKYMNISPQKAWSGEMVKFGFLFSRPKNKFIYSENANDPIRVGSIVYVSLCLIRGIKNIGVAFEITGLDESTKTISFCYLSGGASNGTQEIQLSEMPNGDTKISHLSRYRSRSAFRDKELYPIFHDRFVCEFHENILSQIEYGL